MEAATATAKVTDQITAICKQELAAMIEQQATAAGFPTLEIEIEALAVESAAIETSTASLVERLESARRVLRFENDKSIALGKNANHEHEKLTSLVEQLGVEAAKLAERKREIAQRCQVIESEKQTALRRSAEEFRDAAIALIRGSETALASILDQTRDTLNRLEAQLAEPIYRADQLTADERSDAWRTLHSLYSGAAR